MIHKDISKICVSPEDSIRQVMDRMAENKPAATHLPADIVLVVGAGGRLLGIVTGGDIRRGLVHGVSEEASVRTIMNRNPFLIEGPKSNEEILSLVIDTIRKKQWHKDRLNKIIIVDHKRRVTDVFSLYDLWQSTDARFKHIGVVGLGYVGLTLALTFADLGFRVKGLDANQKIAASLQKGKPHFFEAGLETLLADHLNKNFRIVRNFEGDNYCDIYFIAVGTPMTKRKRPCLTYLEDAARTIGRVLKFGDTVILRSTVPLGTTRDVIAPILERVSGLKAGEEFFIAFAPERTIEGKALEELRTLPQIVGGINRTSSAITANLFSYMTHSVHLVDSPEEAEMVKLINNTYRDVTFGYANEISLICQRWGIDTHRVIQASNSGYPRGGVPYPSPGVGGYCLEKDPFILIESARKKGVVPHLTHHARMTSEAMIKAVSGSLDVFLKKRKKSKRAKILINGFAFKGNPVTSDTRDAATRKVVAHLRKIGYTNIHGYDPAVSKSDILSCGALPVGDIRRGFRDADAVLVMTNHPSFAEADIRTLADTMRKPALLFDGWAVYSREEVEKIKGITYQRL